MHEVSIPRYFADYINPDINLRRTPKICCPFHKEDTPSFSYSVEKDKWRCFGACKHGGDVIELVKFHKKFATREEAEKHLNRIYHIQEKIEFNLKEKQIETDEIAIEYYDYLNKALRWTQKNKDTEAWLELDYIMSKRQELSIMAMELKEFCNARNI